MGWEPELDELPPIEDWVRLARRTLRPGPTQWGFRP